MTRRLDIPGCEVILFISPPSFLTASNTSGFAGGVPCWQDARKSLGNKFYGMADFLAQPCMGVHMREPSVELVVGVAPLPTVRAATGS